jgi:hypothetical protein
MSKAIKLISVLEIVGGVFGIGLIVWALASASGPYNLFSLLIVPLLLGIDALSLIAGVALWRGSSFGRKASLVVQTIQIPKLASPLLTFAFSFGLDLSVYYLLAGNFTKLGFEFKVLAFNAFHINMPGAPMGLGVSLTACVFLALLFRYQPGVIAHEIPPLPPPPPAEWDDKPEAAFPASHDDSNNAPPSL